ncbi:MAG: hypothetical protein HQ536_03405 [Parcubacteria group bacterium]|nr:hypothetical protein [Parcubacteria group bacterium]
MDNWSQRRTYKTLSTIWEKKFYPIIKNPPAIEIKAFKEGYKNGHKVFMITKNDPQVIKWSRLNQNAIDTTGNTPGTEESPRDVLIVLEPIPGYAITTAWKDTGLTRPEENISFQIQHLKVTPNGNHAALISGKIAAATKYVSYEQEREKIYTDGSAKIRETRFVRGKVSYVPKTVTLDNPFGPNPTLPVTEDGSFKGILQTKKAIFFRKPNEKSYRTIKEESNFVTKVWDSDISDNIIKSESYPLPKVFIVLPDYAAAREYALSMTCAIRLDVKEKVTKKKIAPEITITAVIAPTASEIKDMFLRKFGNDNIGKDLSDETISFLVKRGFLVKGKRVREDAQRISFIAYVNGEYQVETVHGKYYYFKGSIKPTTTEPISNTILLIEVGGKVRTQQVKESEAGSMIDSDD